MRYLHCPQCRAKLGQTDGHEVTCDHAGRRIVASGSVTVHCHKAGCAGYLTVMPRETRANGQKAGWERVTK